MDRLTKTYSDGTHGANDNLPCGENSYTYKGLLLEALGKYEDAEEQGLLLRLPCKVGSTVYHIANKRILEVENADVFFLCLCVAEGRFGKTVFLTQAEAEYKLKEMESGEDNE